MIAIAMPMMQAMDFRKAMQAMQAMPIPVPMMPFL